MSLEELRERAAKLGVQIDADDLGEGEDCDYWLLDAETGEGVWDVGNFCSSLDEVEWKIGLIENERSEA